jgi:hypothetical protein
MNSWNDMGWRKTEVPGEKLCHFVYKKYYEDVTLPDTSSLEASLKNIQHFSEQYLYRTYSNNIATTQKFLLASGLM